MLKLEQFAANGTAVGSPVTSCFRTAVTDQLLLKLEELAAAGTAMSHLRAIQSCAPGVTPPKKNIRKISRVGTSTNY